MGGDGISQSYSLWRLLAHEYRAEEILYPLSLPLHCWIDRGEVGLGPREGWVGVGQSEV